MADSISQFAKIKLKVGSMEIEYEGDPVFLTSRIETLLATMGNLATKLPVQVVPSEPAASTPPANTNDLSASKGELALSTNTIAAHLDAKSGPELVICAMAQLELVQGLTSSTRNEILAEMKGATNYYNVNMSSNLSQSLGTLTKAKRITQIAKDTYALSAAERKQVEAKIAEIG